MNAAKLREASQDHWWIDCSTICALWANLSQPRCKQHKLELFKGLTGGQPTKCVQRLLGSLHRRIRAVVQTKGGHIPYQRRYHYIVSLVNCSRINPYMLTSLFNQFLKLLIKMLIIAYHFHLFNSIWLTKILLMQNNIRKSAPLFHLFLKSKVILVELCIL